MTKELIVKDPQTYNFYKKRSELFGTLLEAYEAKKEYCETTKLSAEMDAIHLQTLIMQTEEVKQINDEQMNQKYSFDKERDIIKKYQEIAKGDFTESEKETVQYYMDKIKNAELKYVKKMKKVEELQTELKKEVERIWGYQLTLPFSPLTMELCKF